MRHATVLDTVTEDDDHTHSSNNRRSECKRAYCVARYFVLLLLTDGGVTDYAATVRALVDASHLPLSVLIVGVGDGNFGERGQDTTLMWRFEHWEE